MDFARINSHGLLGTPGYSLPDRQRLRAIPFSALGDLPNFEIHGGPCADDNVAFIEDGAAVHGKLVVEVSENTHGARLVIGSDLTLTGTIKFLSVEQSVVLAGGLPEVGHSGAIQIEMWRPEQVLFFGRRSTSNGSMLVLAGDGRSIIVGDDCMLSHGIHLSTFDQHAVIDLETEEQLNEPGDIVIEPHVWLGRQSTVSKNVVVGLGSIVGAHSLVLKSCPRMATLGGVPARVLRRNVTWDRKAVARHGTAEKIRRLSAEVKEFSLPPPSDPPTKPH